jgi:hypothetical protein
MAESSQGPWPGADYTIAMAVVKAKLDTRRGARKLDFVLLVSGRNLNSGAQSGALELALLARRHLPGHRNREWHPEEHHRQQHR